MSLGPLKVCFKCGVERPICEFYKHSQMGDGYLNKCKDCTRSDVQKNRALKLDHYRAYDRARNNLPHRVEARLAYEQTDAYREAHRRAFAKSIADFPRRRKARIAVGNAIRDGRLIRQPCLICGDKAEAHHPDYDAPLDVVWLCTLHHKQAHALVREQQRYEGVSHGVVD
jgi:hypothetical protein